MRITGGSLGGRTLRVPRKGVRPTQDKVRGALFSALGEHVAGARVLDLFAGSGALGLEAWSRGASSVCWVERDPGVFRILKENVKDLCGPDTPDSIALRRTDARRFLNGPSPGAAFDLVLADPPYDHGDDDWQLALGRDLLPWTRAGSIFVLEVSTRTPPAMTSGWTLAKQRDYGDTRLLYRIRDESTGAEQP